MVDTGGEDYISESKNWDTALKIVMYGIQEKEEKISK